MKSRLGLVEMKLNQFTLPARMANKAACWGRSYRTLKPKGRLSHAWAQDNRYALRERELLRELSDLKPSLTPKHYLSPSSFLTTTSQPTMASCKTRLAMKDQVGQAGSKPCVPVPKGKEHVSLVTALLYLGACSLTQHFYQSRERYPWPLFLYLSCTGPMEGTWAWLRLTPECVGGCLELAGDMPQLVFQVHNDNLALSFLRRKELKFTVHLLCARSPLDFHLVSQYPGERVPTLSYR